MYNTNDRPHRFAIGSPEGLAEALQRIANAKNIGADELDLGGLGLTEVPEELFELTQLKVLYLGLPKPAAEKAPGRRTWGDREACNAVKVLPPAFFASLHQLVKIHLEYNQLIGLPETIGQATQLSSLDLSSDWLDWNQIGDEGAKALRCLANLTSLHLRSNGIGAEGAKALRPLVNLTSLDLAHNGIGAEGAKALRHLINLTSLDLEENGIGAEGAKALRLLVNLTSLNLEDNGIGNEGAKALRPLVSLTSLNLARNKIGAEGAKALKPFVKLTALDLRANSIGDEGTKVLSPLVNLTSLSLRGNSIGAEGAKALKPLVNLTALDLGRNEIGAKGVKALKPLVKLTSLHLDGSGIGAEGAKALGPLVNLTSLFLDENDIGAEGAEALRPLVNLTFLSLNKNGIGDEGAKALSPLVNLTSISLRDNGIGDEGATGLSSLINLTSLNFGDNDIGAEGAKALSPLVNLVSLDLGVNPYGLHACKYSFWGNDIGAEGAKALSCLVNLTSLNLGDNDIGAEGAKTLSPLVNLTFLDLTNTGVENLSPLLNLKKLEWLDCSGCHLRDPIPELWAMPSLEGVVLHQTSLRGVPAEVLSQKYMDNCLDSLRAHFADLEGGGGAVTEVKLMFLGNGQVGKTQTCRRLQGKTYDPSVPSTHGVQVRHAALPLAPDDTVALKMWDFGGQDIYHGTHALFLKTRAIFPLVWTPEGEATQFHEYGGFTFRNQPLGYWLAYVRHFAGPDAPMLVIQAQCDGPELERLRPPVPDEALEGFPFRKVLHYSAKENRGRAALDEALAEAVHWLRKRQGVALIGKGRAKVKTLLEKMYDSGTKLITQAKFHDLCRKVKNISSPPLLLEYLHNTGTVFYREGLFGEAIILDQAWALEAVYAVFDRESQGVQKYRALSWPFPPFRSRRMGLAEAWRKRTETVHQLHAAMRHLLHNPQRR